MIAIHCEPLVARDFDKCLLEAAPQDFLLAGIFGGAGNAELLVGEICSILHQIPQRHSCAVLVDSIIQVGAEGGE